MLMLLMFKMLILLTSTYLLLSNLINPHAPVFIVVGAQTYPPEFTHTQLNRCVLLRSWMWMSVCVCVYVCVRRCVRSLMTLVAYVSELGSRVSCMCVCVIVCLW